MTRRSGYLHYHEGEKNKQKNKQTSVQYNQQTLYQSRSGGSGFFLACEEFGRMISHSFTACAFVVFFKVEIRSRTLIPFFPLGSVHSGSASWDNCGRVFPEELRVSSSPDRFRHDAWTAQQSAHSDFFGSRVYASLGVTCHLHFWQNERGLLPATAVTRGWNGHRITVSSQINSGGKKNSPATSAGIRTRNPSITCPAL